MFRERQACRADTYANLRRCVFTIMWSHEECRRLAFTGVLNISRPNARRFWQKPSAFTSPIYNDTWWWSSKTLANENTSVCASRKKDLISSGKKNSSSKTNTSRGERAISVEEEDAGTRFFHLQLIICAGDYSAFVAPTVFNIVWITHCALQQRGLLQSQYKTAQQTLDIIRLVMCSRSETSVYVSLNESERSGSRCETLNPQFTHQRNFWKAASELVLY